MKSSEIFTKHSWKYFTIKVLVHNDGILSIENVIVFFNLKPEMLGVVLTN